MNRHKFSVLILLLLTIICVVGCGIEKNTEATEEMKKGIHVDIQISSEAIGILGEESIVEIAYPQVVDMKDRKIKESVNGALKEFAIKQQELLRQNSKILYTDFETTYIDENFMSILFKYGMSSDESDSDGYELFSAINVDLTTGMFIDWDYFISMFDDKYTADDKAMLSFRIDEMKTDEQINPLQTVAENSGFYRDDNGINIYYYDRNMQIISIPKNTIPFMFPEYAQSSDKSEESSDNK